MREGHYGEKEKGLWESSIELWGTAREKRVGGETFYSTRSSGRGRTRDAG